MSRQAFNNFMRIHEKDIVRELYDRLNQRPQSNYQDFFLRTEEGLQRLEIWVHLVINAIGSQAETLFRDQEKVAYTRAVEGFSFEDISHVYLIMHSILNDIIRKAGSMPPFHLHDVYSEMRENMFRGHHILATMFLKTREEVISEKMYHLKSLHDFTRAMIENLEVDEIAGMIVEKSRLLLKMDRSFMVLFQDHRVKGVFSHPAGTVDGEIFSLMERSY